MSILWGTLKPRGTSVREAELRAASALTAQYATGDIRVHVQEHIGMGFQLNATNARTLLEQGPVCDPAGNIVCFDGRLDNFRELADMLELDDTEASDSSIVLAAFLRWKEECFARFTGDWALALWSNRDKRLFLARDHAGARTLYLHQGEDEIRWSTYLDTLLATGEEHRLSETYAAAYLSCHPVQQKTPYEGIAGILPGHYVVACEGSVHQRPHWSPLVRTTIRYKRDKEYDEQFLSVFEQAVVRRTGPGAPVLAQLSGGMDSTAIVCMSDRIRGRAEAELLDTLSFYDDSETSLNERAYFTITEARRGKTGIHINTAFSERTFDPPFTSEGSYLLPGADSHSIVQERRLVDCAWKKGYRSVLSGIGGDEVLGGIPTPYPELAGYLVSGNLTRLSQQSLDWCLTDRSPLVFSLCETLRFTYQLYASRTPWSKPIPPWLSPTLRGLAVETRDGGVARLTRLGASPHQVDNALSWVQIMETLPHLQPLLLFRPEYRYPMLDKDLISFLFSIPREQLVKPGRRRAMMRRALRDIVPNEILERRRKAFQLRAPLSALEGAQAKLNRLWDSSLLAQQGFIDANALRDAFTRCVNGDSQWTQAILKTIAYELWLLAREGKPPPGIAKSESATSRMSLAG
jgi:asparagine synthase (glutamine-hydrolysing)